MRASNVATDHAVVAVLLNLKERFARSERGGLGAATNRMERANTRVAEPAEDQLLGASSGDHLVVDEIWRHARKGEVAALLADDLVPSGE